jgi:hypothetical protein
VAPQTCVLPAFRPQPVHPHATNYENFYGASFGAVSAPEANNWQRVTVGRVNTARLLDMCGNHG